MLTIDEADQELIVFGGLGNSPRTGPYNDRVYSLDLTANRAKQQWVLENEDLGVTSAWFTSTRGFVDIDDSRYLACTDDNVNSVYVFDPDTYTFSVLSTSTLGEAVDAGDCCAAGVKVNGEERIYILGGAPLRLRATSPERSGALAVESFRHLAGRGYDAYHRG